MRNFKNNSCFILVSAAILLLTSSCMPNKKVESPAYNFMLNALLSHSVNEISPNQIDSVTNIIYLDSREKEEYKVSHIKNAVWVGFEDFDMNRIEGISKDKKIVVYCAVGARSEKISEKLVKNGYSDVSNLYGGIFEWVNDGRPVYNKNGKTPQVHAFNKTWGIWLNKGEKIYEVKSVEKK